MPGTVRQPPPGLEAARMRDRNALSGASGAYWRTPKGVELHEASDRHVQIHAGQRAEHRARGIAEPVATLLRHVRSERGAGCRIRREPWRDVFALCSAASARPGARGDAPAADAGRRQALRLADTAASSIDPATSRTHRHAATDARL